MTRQNPHSSSEAIARRARRGFNLIEAAIVLGVVGAVIGTIWVSAANMYESHKVNKTVGDLALIVRNTQSLISNREADIMGTSDLRPTLISAGVIPQDWLQGGSPKTPFGGSVAITNQTNVLSTLYIVFSGTPQSICIKLIVKISSMGAAAGCYNSNDPRCTSLSKIDVNWPNWNAITFPISLDDAKIACNQNSNSVGFKYGYTRNN